MADVYLAAPFFSEAERAFNQVVLDAIEERWATFYPPRDGLLFSSLVGDGMTEYEAARLVFEKDRTEIAAASCVVAVLDGRTPDEGVCVEIGLARAADRPIIGLSTDERKCFPWGRNPMITGAVRYLADNVEDLIAAMWVVLSKDTK